MTLLITSNSLPEDIKEARKAKGLSQSQLAAMAGIDASNISKYENRDHVQHGRPRAETLRALNAALFDAVGDSPSHDLPVAGFLAITRASTDQLIQELKRRGAISVTVTW